MTLNVERHLAHPGARKHVAKKTAECLLPDIRSEARTGRNVRLQEARHHHELQLASELQSELLPAVHPPEARIDLGARSVAARMVGGDFYDFSDTWAKPSEMSVAREQRRLSMQAW